jgi:hypothetical protein
MGIDAQDQNELYISRSVGTLEGFFFSNTRQSMCLGISVGYNHIAKLQERENKEEKIKGKKTNYTKLKGKKGTLEGHQQTMFSSGFGVSTSFYVPRHEIPESRGKISTVAIIIYLCILEVASCNR